MYMRRLFEFIGIKMKPVRPYFQDSRHRLYSSASCNLLVPKLFSRLTDRLYCLFLGHTGKRLLTFGRKLTENLKVLSCFFDIRFHGFTIAQTRCLRKQRLDNVLTLLC